MAARSAAAAPAPKGCLEINFARMELKDGHYETPPMRSSPNLGTASLMKA